MLVLEIMGWALIAGTAFALFVAPAFFVVWLFTKR
jgi:hypothetical protein